MNENLILKAMGKPFEWKEHAESYRKMSDRNNSSVYAARRDYYNLQIELFSEVWQQTFDKPFKMEPSFLTKENVLKTLNSSSNDALEWLQSLLSID